MALTFADKTSDKITITETAAMIDLDKVTYLTWIKMNSLTSPTVFGVTKDDQGGGGTLRIGQQSDTSGNFRIFRGGATQGLNYTTNDNPLVAGTWTFVAADYDFNTVAHIYTGTLTTLAVERTYAFSDNGTGAITTDTGEDMIIGNRHANSGDDDSADFDLAYSALYDTVLTLAQIQSLQFHPRVLNSNCLWNFHVGWQGVTTITDYSGLGNDGTGTGLVQASHVPLGPPFGFDLSWDFTAAVLPMDSSGQLFVMP